MKYCNSIDYEIVGGVYSLAKNPNAKKCMGTATSNSNFCPKHQDAQNFYQSFTTGSEHNYNPKLWSHPYIEGTHNCYTYFLNNQIKAIQDRCNDLCLKNSKNCPEKVEQCGNLKPQPGDYYSILNFGEIPKTSNKYTCNMLEQRIMNDNPEIKKTRFDAKCPTNYYKGAMVVDPGHTFHFYRQNPDATWSHKPGTLPVTNKDASNKVIYVPHFADKNYNKDNKKDGINYTDFCGYYCIPNNKYINTHSI